MNISTLSLRQFDGLISKYKTLFPKCSHYVHGVVISLQPILDIILYVYRLAGAIGVQVMFSKNSWIIVHKQIVLHSEKTVSG